MASPFASHPALHHRLRAQPGQSDRSGPGAAGVRGGRGPIAGRHHGTARWQHRTRPANRHRGLGGRLPLRSGDVLPDPLGPGRRPPADPGRIVPAAAHRRPRRHRTAAGRSGLGGGAERPGTAHRCRRAGPCHRRHPDVRADLHGHRITRGSSGQQPGQRGCGDPVHLDGRCVLRPRRRRRRHAALAVLRDPFRHPVDGRPALPAWGPPRRPRDRAGLGSWAR